LARIGATLAVLCVASFAGADGSARPATVRSRAATQIGPGGAYLIRGLDREAHRIYVVDTESEFFRQSDDWGVTFSANKGFPPGLTGMSKIVRFHDRIYGVGRSATTGLIGIYAAVPTDGDEPLTWTGPSLTIRPPAAVLQTDLSADARYLYVGEYGDPAPGPRALRSSDGVHWRTVFGPDRRIRHIHAITPDPFRAGHVWMAVGDGVDQSIWFSPRHGARGTWRVVAGSAIWQSVQISFDPERIYFAADASGRRTFYVLERATGRIHAGTPERYQAIHPPGGPPAARYLANAYFGSVDSTTGAYYFVANDESGFVAPDGGTWQGFFAVRRVGGRVRVLDPGGIDRSMDGEVFVGGGRVWSGAWWVPALR
jgi:hypothetical protein